MIDHKFRIVMTITVTGDDELTVKDGILTVGNITDSIQDMAFQDSMHGEHGWGVEFEDPTHIDTTKSDD
jgi:hypothetical protein